MPLTAKGQEILSNLEKEYGSAEKAKQVLYAGKNKGTFTGIDSRDDAANATRGDSEDIHEVRDRVIDAACRSLQDSMIGIERAAKRMDAAVRDDAEALTNIRCDEWSEEAREAALKARQAGASHATKTVSVKEAGDKIRNASAEKLHAALKHQNTDPKVKKMIEKELDDRANRGKNEDLYSWKAGTHKGHGM